jgi:hypothetical protein
MKCTGFVLIYAFLTCEEPTKPTAVVCPPLVGWSKTEQAGAAAELRKLPAGSPLRRMAAVNIKQRDVVRACSEPVIPAAGR